MEKLINVRYLKEYSEKSLRDETIVVHKVGDKQTFTLNDDDMSCLQIMITQNHVKKLCEGGYVEMLPSCPIFGCEYCAVVKECPMNTKTRHSATMYQVEMVDGNIQELESCKENKEIKRVLKFPEGVTNLNEAFHGCSSLVEIPPIPDGVRTCENMLRVATSFNQSLVIPEGVENCSSMLLGATSFNQPLNLPKSVRDCRTMLGGATSFNQPLVIPEGVKDCSWMLAGATSFNQPLSLPKGVVDCSWTLTGATSFNQPLTLSKGVKDCRRMLEDARSFNQPLNLPESVEDCSYLLEGAKSFKQAVRCTKKQWDKVRSCLWNEKEVTWTDTTVECDESLKDMSFF